MFHSFSHSASAGVLSSRVGFLATLVLLSVAFAGAADAQAAPGYPVAVGMAFRDKPWSPEMVVIPAGSFVMGSSEDETTREKRAAGPAASEKPQHKVDISAPFAIGKYHVTVAQFDRFVKATGRTGLGDCIVNDHGKWGPQPNRSYTDTLFPHTDGDPVTCVTWNDAKAYADWLSAQTGAPYRLIHEDEFEYAARAGTTTARWWGDAPGDLCKYVNAADQSYDRGSPGDPQTNTACDDGYFGTSPVGHFGVNPWGLADMFGNAWQWMGDCFRDNYTVPAPADVGCEKRVIRGGSWHNYPNVIRAANRFWLAPTMRSTSAGFRVARDPGAVKR